jgi:TatD DNase family protein
MIDTHCHLVDPQFATDLNDVLRRARQAGLSRIVNAGYDVETSEKAVAMAHEYDWLMPAVGIHPNEAAAESIKQMSSISAILQKHRVIAIGETGLDYYRDFSPWRVNGVYPCLFILGILWTKRSDCSWLKTFIMVYSIATAVAGNKPGK